MMSYEDIVKAKEELAAKEAAAATGKRGRKRKSTTPAGTMAKMARRSEVEVAEDEIAAGRMGNYCSVLQL